MRADRKKALENYFSMPGRDRRLALMVVVSIAAAALIGALLDALVPGISHTLWLCGVIAGGTAIGGAITGLGGRQR